MHHNPRDEHAMYASLGSSMGFQSGGQRRQNNGGSSNPLKRLYRK